nr:phospholipase A2 inhibitor and Ly6/PLAUR domain-containing protein-like [Anolis sagrei ordinatus]
METLFTISLLAVFIATGFSLQCEICGIRSTCNGVMRTCHFKHDKCSITLLESSGNKYANNVQRMIKNCINSSFCDVDLGIINMGQAGLIQSNRICCIEDDCKRISPTLSGRNTTSNGKVCPACFAMEKRCKEDNVYCAGDEFYCIEGTGTGTAQTGEGTSAPNFILKGCATEGACEDLRGASLLLPWSVKESQYHCVTALEASGILEPQYEAAEKTSKNAENAGVATIITELFGIVIPILAMQLL